MIRLIIMILQGRSPYEQTQPQGAQWPAWEIHRKHGNAAWESPSYYHQVNMMMMMMKITMIFRMTIRIIMQKIIMTITITVITRGWRSPSQSSQSSWQWWAGWLREVEEALTSHPRTSSGQVFHHHHHHHDYEYDHVNDRDNCNHRHHYCHNDYIIIIIIITTIFSYLSSSWSSQEYEQLLKDYLAEEQEIANMEADIKEFEYKNGYWIKW